MELCEDPEEAAGQRCRPWRLGSPRSSASSSSPAAPPASRRARYVAVSAARKSYCRSCICSAKRSSGGPQARWVIAPYVRTGPAGGSSSTTCAIRRARARGRARARRASTARSRRGSARGGARAASASAATTRTGSPEATSAPIVPAMPPPRRSRTGPRSSRGRRQRRRAGAPSSSSGGGEVVARGSPTSAIGAGAHGRASRSTSRGSTLPLYSLSSSEKVASSGRRSRPRDAEGDRARARCRPTRR